VTLAPAQVSASCPFCGSAQVVVDAAEPDLIAPEGVLPFRLAAPAALAQARAWLAAERFRPGNLPTRATLLPPRPVYLPAWTFDISGEVRWFGYVSHQESGPRLTMLHKGSGMALPLPGIGGLPGQMPRWVRERVEGSEPILYDDLLVPASPAVPAAALAALRFDTHALVPYSPDLLADWPAEIYRVAVADASLQAREQAVQTTRAHLDAATTGVEELTVTGAQMTVLSYKLVLLPIWLTAYTYDGQHYQLLVNGHSGQVDGAIPRTLLQRALDQFFGGE